MMETKEQSMIEGEMKAKMVVYALLMNNTYN